MISHVATFPVAVHEGSPSVWNLATVLRWLSTQQQHRFDAALVDIAEAAMKLNIAKEMRRLPGVALPGDLAPLFA